MNSLDKKYQDLLKQILEEGHVKGDRTGTGTISIFGTQLKHKMNEGFPLLTTKKVYWKGVFHELLWFLKGDTNIKYLVDNNVNIWNGDAYKKYCQVASGNDLTTNSILFKNEDGSYRMFKKEEFIEKIKTDFEFCKKWGELGPVYGEQWRNWKSFSYHYGWKHYGWKIDKSIDQIANLIEKLKTNPDDRRMIVSAWNVSELSEMTLPPCHYAFEIWTRELTLQERNEYYTKKYRGIEYDNHEILNKIDIPKHAISLKWVQRSVDSLLGLPFNIASYGLLLSMIAKVVNMIPEDLIFSGGDTHLYLNHIEQSKEQLKRDSFELPKISFKKEYYESLDDFSFDDIILQNYQSHDTIKADLSN